MIYFQGAHVTMPNESGIEGSDQALVQYLADPIYRARGWMKFLAVLAFIGGGLTAITIIGIVFAWVPILFGVFLWQSATAIDTGYNQVSVEQVHRAHDKLRVLFIAYGILAIVYILAIVVFFGAVVGGLGDLDLDSLS